MVMTEGGVGTTILHTYAKIEYPLVKTGKIPLKDENITK